MSLRDNWSKDSFAGILIIFFIKKYPIWQEDFQTKQEKSRNKNRFLNPILEPLLRQPLWAQPTYAGVLIIIGNYIWESQRFAPNESNERIINGWFRTRLCHLSPTAWSWFTPNHSTVKSGTVWTRGLWLTVLCIIGLYQLGLEGSHWESLITLLFPSQLSVRVKEWNIH